MKIYNAKELSARIEVELKEEVAKMSESPILIVIQANDDAASGLYVGNKIKACERVGIRSKHFKFESDITAEALLALIEGLNNNKIIDGILLQMPLFDHLKPRTQEILQAISPDKDVDCFSYENIGKMAYRVGVATPLTAKGVMDILEDNDVDIKGKHAVVIGRSLISGKSVADLLLDKNATVTICHSKTVDLKKHTRDADILVSCVGKPKFIKAEDIKEGCVVINVGFSKDENGKTCGDIDFDDMVASEKPSLITTTFNSTGTMTVTNLLRSTVQLARLRRK